MESTIVIKRKVTIFIDRNNNFAKDLTKNKYYHLISLSIVIVISSLSSINLSFSLEIQINKSRPLSLIEYI